MYSRWRSIVELNEAHKRGKFDEAEEQARLLGTVQDLLGAGWWTTERLVEALDIEGYIDVKYDQPVKALEKWLEQRRGHRLWGCGSLRLQSKEGRWRVVGYRDRP